MTLRLPGFAAFALGLIAFAAVSVATASGRAVEPPLAIGALASDAVAADDAGAFSGEGEDGPDLRIGSLASGEPRPRRAARIALDAAPRELALAPETPPPLLSPFRNP